MTVVRELSLYNHHLLAGDGVRKFPPMDIVPNRYDYDSLIKTVSYLKNLDGAIVTSNNFHFDSESELSNKDFGSNQLISRLGDLIHKYPVSVHSTWEDAQQEINQMAVEIAGINNFQNRDIILAATQTLTDPTKTPDPGGYGENGERTILLFNNPDTFLPHFVVLPYYLPNAAEQQ